LIELAVEFQEGTMWVGVNGKGQTIQHENVSLKGRDELTRKTCANAPNRIMFDSVMLRKAD
jgi:nicotinamide mononucleotide (NMN) deamidase PncC